MYYFSSIILQFSSIKLIRNLKLCKHKNYNPALRICLLMSLAKQVVQNDITLFKGFVKLYSVFPIFGAEFSSNILQNL